MTDHDDRCHAYVGRLHGTRCRRQPDWIRKNFYNAEAVASGRVGGPHKYQCDPCMQEDLRRHDEMVQSVSSKCIIFGRNIGGELIRWTRVT